MCTTIVNEKKPKIRQNNYILIFPPIFTLNIHPKYTLSKSDYGTWWHATYCMVDSFSIAVVVRIKLSCGVNTDQTPQITTKTE